MTINQIAFRIALAIAPLLSQAPLATKPSFEVALIKPSAGDGRESLSIQPGGRFVANNVTLKMMIGFAYRLRNYELAGGPAWIGADKWSIDARAEAGAEVGADVTAVRLQALIEERFGLKTHREMRELPAYRLTVGNGGSKLIPVDPPAQQTPGQPSAAPPPPPVRPDGTLPPNFMPVPGRTIVGPGLILASTVPIAEIVRVLTGQLGRPVLDETNLKGFYNVRLQFAPETTPNILSAAPGPASDTAGSSIFTSIQEQLGLKLESGKAPFDVMVIDSAQKPTDN
jgi:uncharacterized protein (TIGR03435 family)